ncbi:exopolysaccharide biosynthesis polyprenyl glycosylphosphotransferase [Acidisoma cellulosilytica]|uniref:Exopolysaccharide biosynthesis polyprenyl glycosylphosphotransferase n=1 Tax=Acidisoma cellulosilyticum TaxID=2802395 RepID=A0A964E4I6_9PROT|nr:exopolysaccharide biosynthesis polyprenyl glycosylphosphotransferase [Acidisoma cellulosilyticum]MCB8881745.1 exopolysaccharide biosynthesis polyprenyl glycosylphosphotransferase [Acidisoma cellulosilyticum]
MTTLKGHPISPGMAENHIDFLSRAQPKFSPAICAMAFLAADIVSAMLAQGLVGGTALLSAVDHHATLQSVAPNLLDVTVILGVVVLYLAIRGRYTTRTPFWTEASQIFSIGGWAVGAYILASLLNNRIDSHLSGLATLVLFPFIATFANALTKSMLTQVGLWRLPIVVIGTGEAAIAVEAAIASDPGLGYAIVSRIDPRRIVLQSNSSFLWSILERHQAGKILFALDDDSALQRQLIDQALRDKVPFGVVPGPQAMPALGWRTTRFFSQDVVMLSFQHGSHRSLAQSVKSGIDVLAAILLLILSSPIFLVAAIFNLFSNGPLFFAHQRLGIGGKMFPCLKFRTMVVDGDRVLQEALARDPELKAEWDLTQKLRHDPRVTPFGRFLRKTSLDELPQLVNVIRRQMSLVGPRPIVQSEVRFYGDDIAHYFNTRPGVTGLWQVSGRSNTTYARRVQLDVWYVNNWSVWLDITVLLKTLPAVLARTGAH